MSSLAHHFLTMAHNNAWSNHRLLAACARLSQEDFVAPRTSFFPSLKATLNHIVTVDWYYVDALERWRHGRPVNREPDRFFEPEEPFDGCGELAVAQHAVDRRLVEVCAALADDELEQLVPVMRRAGVQPESVTPPQLDEFFCANEAHLRARELAELGTSEAAIWGPRAAS